MSRTTSEFVSIMEPLVDDFVQKVMTVWADEMKNLTAKIEEMKQIDDVSDEEAAIFALMLQEKAKKIFEKI